MPMTLTSPDFTHNGDIPREFTCEGDESSPELNWDNVPEGTHSFVLICDDPDVPRELIEYAPDLVWDHWVLFNIPRLCRKIERNEKLGPEGSTCGLNSWGRNDWGGPCPPNALYHRYFFKLYALNCALILDESADKALVQLAMRDNILEEAVLKGRYMKTEYK